jgi:uncharacterized membrane protein
MGTETNSLIQNHQYLVTVPINLHQAGGYCSHYFGSGCWLLFPLFWIRLLVTVLVILDQAVGFCSHYFGSGY